METDAERSIDLFCRDSNVQVEARVVATDVTAEPVRPVPYEDVVDTPHNVTAYVFARCKRCGAPFLVQENSCEVFGDFSVDQGSSILYPPDRVFNQEGIPKSVLGAYRNASRSFAVGLYEPCVIMCRKALEGVASELGASRGSLKRRLDQLTADGRIDRRLSDWAHALRLVGNDAAHDFEVELQKEDARDSIEFLEALLLYVFTLTRRFDEFKERRRSKSEPS